MCLCQAGCSDLPAPWAAGVEPAAWATGGNQWLAALPTHLTTDPHPPTHPGPARPTWHSGWSGMRTPTVLRLLLRPVEKLTTCSNRQKETGSKQ